MSCYLVYASFFVNTDKGYRNGEQRVKICDNLEKVKKEITTWKKFDKSREEQDFSPVDIKVYKADEIKFNFLVKDIKIIKQIEEDDIEVITEFWV